MAKAERRINDYFGRDLEREYIGEQITAEDGSRHVIYISGPGGVGKTALLDLTREIYADRDGSYVVVEPIDFDDLTLRLPVNLMERVVRCLSDVPNGSLFEEFRTLCKQDAARDLARRGQRQEDMRTAFVVGLRQLAAEKRIILLIDTLEKAPIWFPVFFASIASAIPNVVIVLVGRPESHATEKNFEQALSSRDDLPKFRMKSFEWSGLDKSLCETYFAEREEFQQLAQDLDLLGVEVSAELRERIWSLAQGIPFQVNLVAGVLRYLEVSDEALNRQINSLLDQIQQFDSVELEQDPDLRQRFQQALVAPFVLHYNRMELSEPPVDYPGLTSRIILLIAHVNHYMAHALGGFDASVLARLDDALDEEKIRLGLDYIVENRKAQFTFVKVFRGPDGEISGIGLHDEMVRMLNHFAWIRLDPPGLNKPLRQRISQRLIEYYDEECVRRYAEAEGEKQPSPETWARAVGFPEGQALLLARVFHSIYRDFETGWNWVYNLSERIFMRTEFDALLHDSVAAYIQTTPWAQGPGIQAKMDVWKAGAHIARGKLSEARSLLDESIAIWSDQYRDDEDKVKQLEEARKILEKNRLALLHQQRERPEQSGYVQKAIDGFDVQLQEIRELIQSESQFGDLERAYTSLGFTYRLEGRWDQAIEHYNNALRYSRWLGNHENVAEAANNLANVYLLWGRLTDAALYAQIGASIRRQLGLKKELGHSYRILGMINWRVGNTYSSRMYLNQARECYEDDPVALAWLAQYEGYTYYRSGDTERGRDTLRKIPGFTRVPPMRSFALLEQAREVFEQYERTDDLAATYNVLSRAHRRDDEFEKSEGAAKKALELAQDTYRIAEAHLSLCMLYYRWGMERLRAGDKGSTLQEFRKVDEHYEKGFQLAKEGQFVALLSVYHGVKGNVEYERGKDDPSHYDVAFGHYLRECQISAQNKTLRFERALNEVVADRLARMPFDLAMKYADVLTDEASWRDAGLARQYDKVKDEVDELKLFLGLPEEKQIEEMEKRFNEYTRLGDYHDALAQARDALQQFYRYNWSAGTVLVLLKTAQAYRKIAQYTAARRYCKQALFIAEGLIKQQGERIELVRQKAQADYTMARILWEIGNTAEAATHIRKAREVYLKHRQHPDPTIASEMREGLARLMHYEGTIRFLIGEWDQALAFLDWAEAEFRDMGNDRRIAKTLNLKARIYRDRDSEGDDQRAHEALEEGLKLAREMGDKYTTAECCLTYTILEYQESRKEKEKDRRLQHLKAAEKWYQEGTRITRANHYRLLQSVYEGVMGNVQFDQLRIMAQAGEKVNLEPAFDRYAEECRWGAYLEKRRFYRSLDLLTQRFSLLSSDEIRYYAGYMWQKWEQYARAGQLPGQDEDEHGKEEELPALAAEYLADMRSFCDLVEDFSEYIAS